MARPASPPGRPRRIRIGMTCHTGIGPLRKFLDFFSELRQGERPEYLRTCLFIGFRFGHPEQFVWPDEDAPSNGKTRKIQVLFPGDHPCLGGVLKKYDAGASWDKNTRWVLKMIVVGHEIVSGNSLEKEKKEIRTTGEIPASPQLPKDIIGGLFL